MWPTLQPAITFITDKIGKTGMLLVSFFCMGIYVMIEYPKYVVTPTVLKTSIEAASKKSMAATHKVELRIVRRDQNDRLVEQIALEDKIADMQSKHLQITPRDINRLEFVKHQLIELNKSETELTNMLEGQ